MNKEYLTKNEITQRLEPLKLEVDFITYLSIKTIMEKREEIKKQEYLTRMRLKYL